MNNAMTNTLSVSKKVYSDITSRIATTLSFAPTSAMEAIRVVNAYLAGDVSACSADRMAMLAFGMIKAELDRAMTRSARARERARKRRTSCDTDPETATKETATTPNSGQTDEEADEKTAEEPAAVPVMLSRRERRAMARAAAPKKKKRWARISC